MINWLTGTYTLIIIQYTLIVVAAWYSHKLITLKSDNIWLSTGILIYYFTLLGRYTTISCDVNIAVISACFVPAFIYYFKTQKYLISSIFLILLLLSRENIPIWLVFIFIVLIIDHYKDKKAVIFSVVGILISVAYFIILFKVLIPSIETSEKKFTLFNYAALGENPGEAISFVFHHPLETIKLFFINHLNDPAADGIKAEFYWVYLISGGFVLFLRPKYLIWFIPIVAQKMLNDNSFRWGIATYYSIEVVTLLPLSVFLAISAIKSEWLQNRLIIIVCAATVVMTIHKLDASNCRIPWTMTPAKEKFYDKRFYKPPFNVRKVNAILANIPSDAKVSASDHILAHLAQRQSIYLFPTVKDAEYIVFSVYDDYFMISHDENEAARNKYLSDPNWEIQAKEFPVFLLKLKGTKQQIKTTENDKERLSAETILCNYENIDTTNNQVLFNNGVKADTTNFITTEKSFSQNHSIKLSTGNPYSRVVKINDINNISAIQIKVWCYCTEELKANIIADCGKDYTFYSNKSDTITPSGWKRLVLNFWVPQGQPISKCNVSLWNSGSEPVYFDDLQIIKKY